MGVGVPVWHGEPLPWLHTQCGHLTKQVTKREEKIFTFIHGNTPEIKMHPQTGKLFNRKAAASFNLAPRLRQTHRSTQLWKHKGGRSEPPPAPGPGVKPCPPASPWRAVLFAERQGAARSTISHMVLLSSDKMAGYGTDSAFATAA